MTFGDHGQVPGTYGTHLGLHCLIGVAGCSDDGCRCRCHRGLTRAQQERIRIEAGHAARQAIEKSLELALRDASPSLSQDGEAGA